MAGIVAGGITWARLRVATTLSLKNQDCTELSMFQTMAYWHHGQGKVIRGWHGMQHSKENR